MVFAGFCGVPGGFARKLLFMWEETTILGRSVWFLQVTTSNCQISHWNCHKQSASPQSMYADWSILSYLIHLIDFSWFFMYMHYSNYVLDIMADICKNISMRSPTSTVTSSSALLVYCCACATSATRGWSVSGMPSSGAARPRSSSMKGSSEA